MAKQINPSTTITTPGVGTNIGEEVKEQNKERQETKIINEALRDTGTEIDTQHSAIPDKAAFAQATLDWRDYMSNYLENNKKRIIDNTVPKLSVKENKVVIEGTKDALKSSLAQDAKNALKALVGADTSSEQFQKAIDEINTSMVSAVENYVITNAYGFEDQKDYNNYLLAVQEAKKPNPMNSSYFITAKKKDGTPATMKIKDWIDYWKKEYSTDERADLFLNSANSSYGYDRIPYIIMSGGGEAGNARYGFDTGEYLSLGLYNIGAQLSKLPHGLTQQVTAAQSGINDAVAFMRSLGYDDNKSTDLVMNAPVVTEEMFSSIKEKLAGNGPKLGGIDNLSDSEKAILALGTAAVGSGPTSVGIDMERALSNADYNTYRERVKTAREINTRNEQLSAVNERIAKNMQVYGGSSLNFASSMLGVMARQFEEALAIKALTGGAFDMNQLGEGLGNAFADLFKSSGSVLGSATARAVAQFVGGIPEDMLQDLVDSKLTDDPALSEDILTSENVLSNIMYRLAFNAIIKAPKNIIQNARNIKKVADAAKAAGADIDADDLKRGISQAYDAVNKGRDLVYKEDGTVMYYDDDGNLKTMDGVTVWSMQPFAYSPEVDDAVRAKVAEMTEQFKSDKDILKTSDISSVKNYFDNGEWSYLIGKLPGDDVKVDVPTKIKDSLTHTALSGASDYNDAFSALKNNAPKYGLDAKTVYSSVDNKAVDSQLKAFNSAFGTDISSAGSTLPEVLAGMVRAVLKAGREPFTDDAVAKAVNELLGPDKFRRFVISGEYKQVSPSEAIFSNLPRSGDSLNDAMHTIANEYAGDINGRLPGIDLDKIISADKTDYSRDWAALSSLRESIANVMAAYAPAIDKALSDMSIDDVISYTNDAIAGAEALVNNAPAGSAEAVIYKNHLESFSDALGSIRYQLEYNQHFTSMPDRMLNDIHSANPIGVMLNDQKVALMDEAKTMPAADFVKKEAGDSNGLTQNELLEVWTESKYRDMSIQEMVKIMEDEFVGENQSIDETFTTGMGADILASEYIRNGVDRTALDFWFTSTARGKDSKYDAWFSRLEKEGHPAIYQLGDGKTAESGRSILEVQVLSDKKLWAASLVRLKGRMAAEANLMATSVGGDIINSLKLNARDGSAFDHIYRVVYSNMDEAIKKDRATRALGLDRPDGVPESIKAQMDIFDEASSVKAKDDPIAFLQWLAEKYAMGRQLYLLKEFSSVSSMPMAQFLDTPITVSRVEKVWGPNRKVLLHSGVAKSNPTMDLSKETCLSFSTDISGVDTLPSASDPGSVTMRVRPIDIIGDLASAFGGEGEVFVRKSLVYPAGNKMHSIFFDGATTTDAAQVIKDPNARMFQVDESLVVNNYDYTKARAAFAALASVKYSDGSPARMMSELADYLDKKPADGIVNKSAIEVALGSSVYGKQIADAVMSTNPFMKNLVSSILTKVKNDGSNADISKEISTLLNKPLVVSTRGGFVRYTSGIVPDFDNEVSTNGGIHLNDAQAERTVNAQKVLEDWRKEANSMSAKEKADGFMDNYGVMVDGNMVSMGTLSDNKAVMGELLSSERDAQAASDNATMKARLDTSPKDAPDVNEWGNTKTYEFKSYAEALANRPTYATAQNYDAWLPAAVDAGVKEFTNWLDNTFTQNHPNVDLSQMVESWDYVNFLVHKGEDVDFPNIDEIRGKTFVDSSGREVTITDDVLDMYNEFDTFIREQGARIAALEARGFEDDYNQLGYLPHTDYNPLDNTAEEMIQGALWKKNKLKNSTSEDGTFTTSKLNNSLADRYKVWISNMSYDALGDVAVFGEKMKELIADGDIKVENGTTTLKDGSTPQEAVAKSIQGDKDINVQAAKTKSSKDFVKAHTSINDKTDLKALEKQTASDGEKMGMSKAIHTNYAPVYGGGTAKVLTQKNYFVSKITGLYDMMRSTTTTDGSLLTHGGEMLINPVGMANNLVRQFKETGDMRGLVVDLLVAKSGRSEKGAEYIYNKWLPDIQKHVSPEGTINDAELAAVLTKHLRYEAWSGIKKWLARADYDQFNAATRKTLDNLLYRHNMVQQISNNPGVMKTINKALNTIVGMRHRALFYINPKNALQQLSECIRLYSNFKFGDATKALHKLITDEQFRNTILDWKDIVMPERSRLENVEPMADAWYKTAKYAKLHEDGTLDIKGTVKGGITEADAVALAPINAAEDMKNTVILAGIVQEMETKKSKGLLKESEYDYVMRRFQRVALANDEFGRLGYSDNAFARATMYLNNFTIRQLKMFGDNVVDSYGEGGAAKAFGYLAKVFGTRMALFLAMSKLGYSAGQVLGYDPFDMLGDTNTGLDEEDETWLDKQMKAGLIVNGEGLFSPLLSGGLTSLIQDYYFAMRQAYERTNESTPADEAESIAQETQDWGLKMPEVDWYGLLYGWLPGGGAARRTIQMTELMDKGVAISAKGTKMYEAPSDLGDVVAGYLFGRNTTANARAYYQTPDPLQGLIDNGLGGFAQQMGRAFGNNFRQFDPIDTQNYSDWFDGSAADEQQWQSGYYYFRNRAKEIYNAYNGQSDGYISDLDVAELKSGYRAEMEKLGEQLNKFTNAYMQKHGTIDGTKMQQLLNILNDTQANLLMDEATRQQASQEGLNRAQQRYTQAALPSVTKQTGPTESSPTTEYKTRFSPQFYNAVQGYYGVPSEAAKVVEKLYNDKWKDLRKEYSNKAYADGVSFKDREKIQNEYIDLVREDLDGVIANYGSNIITNDAVDDVLTDVFAGMVPYSEYNVNKKGRRVSLPQNVEVDVSDWLKQKYANAKSTPRISYDATAASLMEKFRDLKNEGKTPLAKSTARLILQRSQDNLISLTRSEIEELQKVLND